MIALIGEQSIPNLLVLRREQPDEAIFAFTQRTEEVAKCLCSLLQNDMRIHFCQIDPYDIQRIRESLRHCLQDRNRSSMELIFNLTGGTKPMRFAAYQLAEELQAPFVYLQGEGKRSRLYRYEHQKGG